MTWKEAGTKALVVMGVLFVTGIVWSVIFEEEEPLAPEPKSYLAEPAPMTLQPAPDDGSDVLRKSFMESCSDEPGYYNYCACVWNNVDSLFTTAEILELSERFNEDPNYNPKWFDDIVNECINATEVESTTLL